MRKRRIAASKTALAELESDFGEAFH